MKYAAFLRGINVGGHRKVPMARLKESLERVSCTHVQTLIASGNVVFESSEKSKAKLTAKIEAALKKDFGFSIPTLLKTKPELLKIAKAIPKDWDNSDAERCYVIFLWPQFDSQSTLKHFDHDQKFEDLVYVKGALIWHIERKKITRSKVARLLLKSALYKASSSRNSNTIRKMHLLLKK